jgi:hypothetical protein
MTNKPSYLVEIGSWCSRIRLNEFDRKGVYFLLRAGAAAAVVFTEL